MCQDGCLKILKRADVPMTAKEIARILGITTSNAQKSLKTMFRYNEVNRIGAKLKNGAMTYYYSIRHITENEVKARA